MKRILVTIDIYIGFQRDDLLIANGIMCAYVWKWIIENY